MSSEKPSMHPQDVAFDRSLSEYATRPESDFALTPELLMEDNHSDYAYDKREKWEQARRERRLTVIKACADARHALPEETTINVRSIATAGPVEPFKRLINHQGVQDVVVIAHHDGDTVFEGQAPTGCGGQDTLAAITAGKIHPTEDEEGNKGVLGFVEEHVHHPDPIRNAYQSAFLTSIHTDRPVLAATQDHLTGKIYPIAAFWDSGRKASAAFPLKYMQDEYYDPERIYAEGIPVLEEGDFPDNFAAILEESRRQAIILQRKYRNYRLDMKTQNPHTATINAGKQSYGLTQPDTLRDPNANFNLTVPRDRIDATIHIPDQVIEITADQLQYPIMHTVQNAGNPEKSFADLSNILIETPDIEQSIRVGEAIKKRDWMSQWLELPGRQILVAQKQAGVMTQIDILQ